MKTAEQVLSEVNKRVKNQKDIESRLFRVVKKQLTPNIEGFEPPKNRNCYGIYKEDGGRCLGVLGESYRPTQPEDIYAAINVCANEVPELDMSRLDFKEFRGGSQIAFQLELEPFVIKTKGSDDVTKFKIDFSTSFDGSQANIIRLYTYRLICSNGMMGYGLDFAQKIRNTKHGSDKALSYFSEIYNVMAGIDDYKNRLASIQKIRVRKAKQEQIIQKVFRFKQENPSATTIKKLEAINEAIDLEYSRAGKNMYGLLQGITNFTNHYGSDKEGYNAEENIRIGSGSRINKEAQRVIFQEL